MVSIPVGFFQALQLGSEVGEGGLIAVSIPVGFFQALQRNGLDDHPGLDPVSIPVGFFQALQQRRPAPGTEVVVGFNPCRVFSGLATRSRQREGRAFSLFQSLSGFFRPCNPPSPGRSSSPRVCFNPCRVFSGLATTLASCGKPDRVWVSIPVGFFQALQLPNRLRTEAYLEVSIPVGFFQALQPSCGISVYLAKRVSIPVGFFQALQHHRSGLPFESCACFNPCRVFSGLATSTSESSGTPANRFQSLSGFFRPCNAMMNMREIAYVVMFQSLSGFFRPCNA